MVCCNLSFSQNKRLIQKKKYAHRLQIPHEVHKTPNDLHSQSRISLDALLRQQPLHSPNAHFKPFSKHAKKNHKAIESKLKYTQAKPSDKKIMYRIKNNITQSH